ncbi:hypothetical protein ROZALSC1DRAFT_24296 [Rozella allomycis CSF55]|uniref:Uncharacterized protein n=1 Tax=Rozella allomycis (strain CSF55) TaxID=988480 RepID=A0A4P9YGA9_ROZAC|nr:hypothetical protein ROZALSC1DRAFT_24296 [Rozella allomycis CSF55]
MIQMVNNKPINHSLNNVNLSKGKNRVVACCWSPDGRKICIAISAVKPHTTLMFAIISKKITTEIELPLKAVSWCNKDGYLVVGGSSKSNNVKVDKLDEEVRSNDVSGKIKKLDQILEGHYGKDSTMMIERLLRMPVVINY